MTKTRAAFSTEEAALKLIRRFVCGGQRGGQYSDNRLVNIDTFTTADFAKTFSAQKKHSAASVINFG